MNSNNNTTQAYSGSPINQAENDFAPLQILDNGNDNQRVQQPVQQQSFDTATSLQVLNLPSKCIQIQLRLGPFLT
ncbi:22399_t:CDS:2 [Rhizophagus irregularis]|nr:22399_t:CDS:2 [Rhizophagus irregularis]